MKRLAILSLITLCVAAQALAARADELSAAEAKSLEEAQAAFDKGEHNQVVERLLPLRKRHPTLAEIPRLLTHAYFELGQMDKARETALSAIGRGRLSSDLLVRLAQIDQQRDDRMALTNTLRLLSVLDADNHHWRLIYGDLLAKRQSLSQGEAVFRELIEARPASAKLHLRLGNVLLRQEKLKEAATHFETAWHLGVGNAELPKTIAGVWQQLDDPRQAVAWTERALALPQDDQQRELLELQVAQLHLSLKEYQRAGDAAGRVTKSRDSERKGRAHVLLGRIAMERNNVEEAVKQWEAALASGVDSPQLLAVVGADHFNSGDFAKAAKMLKRVVDGDEPSEQHLRFLVISMIRSDDRAAAREYLRRYIELHGLNDKAKQLVRMWWKT